MGRKKIFSVDIGGREDWVFRGRPLWEGFICIVTRSRVHFAACRIDRRLFLVVIIIGLSCAGKFCEINKLDLFSGSICCTADLRVTFM